MTAIEKPVLSQELSHVNCSFCGALSSTGLRPIQFSHRALLVVAGQAVRLEEGESPGRNVPAQSRQQFATMGRITSQSWWIRRSLECLVKLLANDQMPNKIHLTKNKHRLPCASSGTPKAAAISTNGTSLFCKVKENAAAGRARPATHPTKMLARGSQQPCCLPDCVRLCHPTPRGRVPAWARDEFSPPPSPALCTSPGPSLTASLAGRLPR